MTEIDPGPGPDYRAQHRVIALQCAVQLSHLGFFTNITEVLDHADTLYTYLETGDIPAS